MMICKEISYTYTSEGHQPRLQSISDYTDNVTQSATEWVSPLVHRNVIGSSIHPHSRASECNFYSLSFPWMQIIIEMLQLSFDMTRLLSPGAVYSHSFVRIPPLSYPSIHVTIRPGALICIIQHSWDGDDPLHDYHYYCTNRGEWATEEAHCSLL